MQLIKMNLNIFEVIKSMKNTYSKNQKISKFNAVITCNNKKISAPIQLQNHLLKKNIYSVEQSEHILSECVESVSKVNNTTYKCLSHNVWLDAMEKNVEKAKKLNNFDLVKLSGLFNTKYIIELENLKKYEKLMSKNMYLKEKIKIYQMLNDEYKKYKEFLKIYSMDEIMRMTFIANLYMEIKNYDKILKSTHSFEELFSDYE